MSNGIIRNCASGACCETLLQTKALAVLMKESVEERGGAARDLMDRLPKSKRHEVYLAIAAGLVDQKLIRVSREEATQLRKEGSPTEEELDRMLAS